MDSFTITTANGNQYEFYKIKHDNNGNPRYVVSWLDLGLPKYLSTKETKSVGLAKYNGKNFGGGFVTQSFNLHDTAKHLEVAGLFRK